MALVLGRSESVTPDTWRQLVRRRCGLTFRDTQVPTVLAHLREQMRASGATTERLYYERLAEEPDGGPGWTALIEHLVNHETSFFRHAPSFDALRTRLLPELRQAHGGGHLNLLSAGCSTGQEAYSLAMVAAGDRGVPAGFTVWGGDISRQAIDVARRGRYGRRAIAGIPPEYRSRFLCTAADGASEYEIVEELRHRVRFAAVNLVAEGGVSLTYDVIFCHNVLIYLSKAALSRVVVLLATRLAPGGYLVLGPGEAPTERPALLEPLVVEGVRMFRRRRPGAGEGVAC